MRRLGGCGTGLAEAALERKLGSAEDGVGGERAVLDALGRGRPLTSSLTVRLVGRIRTNVSSKYKLCINSNPTYPSFTLQASSFLDKHLVSVFLSTRMVGERIGQAPKEIESNGLGLTNSHDACRNRQIVISFAE